MVDRLRRRIARSRVAPHISVVVVDAGGGARFTWRGSAPVVPASTQKLAIAAAGLARLGAGYRYTTTVRATRAPDARGVVNGDLIIDGSGDPTLGTPEFGRVEPDRPRTPLEQLARRIKATGIRRVTGRLIADPSFFAHQPAAAGWFPRYFDDLDATRVTGLTVNGGRDIKRSGGDFIATAAGDPAHEAARELQRLLRPIRVDGGTASSHGAPESRYEVASIQSPQLHAILRYMVNESDNHFADMVFRTIGAADGDGTWAGAGAASQRALSPLRLDWTGIVMADGSGLSRANRTTGDFLAALQERMWRSSLRDQWRPLMAVAGRSGTLESRLTDTVANGRFVGKTGSLRDVRSLVGSVTGPRSTHLAVVGNGLSDRGVDRARALIDAVVQIVAEDTYGCRRVAAKPGKARKGTKPRRQPPRLVCTALPR